MKTTHEPLGTPPPSAEEVEARTKEAAERAAIEAQRATEKAARKAASRTVRKQVKDALLVPTLLITGSALVMVAIIIAGLSIAVYAKTGNTFAYLGFGWLSAAYLIALPIVAVVMKLRRMHAKAMARELNRYDNRYDSALLDAIKGQQITVRPGGTTTPGITTNPHPPYSTPSYPSYEWKTGNTTVIPHHHVTS